ncbi:RNAse E [Pontibaca methylaminivorans]|uniref:Ribonuclease E n=2 Tax=Pontibaca methylaminivorans TaxID=515897 RepID=A0A1R3X3T9_9RHOB|nr:RNAse E [Pontibaca methylaminivorans]
MLIDATHAEETRVVVVDGNRVEEFDFESESKRQLAGNIYLAKVTRVEPSLQAAFVDYGGNRHGFLAFSEIHPDYYQIPVADREALMAEEHARAEALHAREEEAAAAATKAERAVTSDAISGMETVEFDEGDDADADEGSSPMERVAETPVADPEDEDSPGDDSNGDSGTNGTIESVVDDDDGTGDSDDLRHARKPRLRRYKIQEVIKVRQILLVQVVKEERGNKGAALTTYLSLAGRYCVLMPNTARGGGISRKITNAADRKKLKEIAADIDVPRGAGLIIRTAGAKRTKAEIRRDYDYLQRLWEQIRELTLKSIAPAGIYAEGDLIKRSIRDLYSREIDEVLVEGEQGYRTAKDFMKMIMPSHAKNVKHYQDVMPLFARYQVESYLGGMFNPVVQLKSGGYLVIGITEALVAIDVNSGRATRESSIEETALHTNLEAAEEIARQLRLRDLAGLIVIDFIDMDERKNNSAVEKKLKDKLKTDRARIQVGRISGFGLLEMSRQRLRPGMLEATTQPCPSCHGTGLIRSDDSMALNILRQIEEEGVRKRSREVLVRVPVGIANFLMNQKREHIAQIEARYGLSVRIEGDGQLASPDFVMEKFKTASRPTPVASSPVVSADASLMEPEAEPDEDETADEDGKSAVGQDENGGSSGGDNGSHENGEGRSRRRRRRPRRRGKGNGHGAEQNGRDRADDADEADAAVTGAGAAADSTAADAPAAQPAEPAPQAPTRTRAPRPAGNATEPEAGDTTEARTAPGEAEPVTEGETATAPRRVVRSRRSGAAAKAQVAPEAPAAAGNAETDTAGAPATPAPDATPEPSAPPVAAVEDAAPAPAPEPAPAPVPTPAPEPEPQAAPGAEAAGEEEDKPGGEETARPRRQGWWTVNS